MKHLKKLFALTLVVALAVTALNISAFGYTDYKEGFYKNDMWIARLTVKNGSPLCSAESSLTSSGTSADHPLRLSQKVTYYEYDIGKTVVGEHQSARTTARTGAAWLSWSCKTEFGKVIKAEGTATVGKAKPAMVSLNAKP